MASKWTRRRWLATLLGAGGGLFTGRASIGGAHEPGAPGEHVLSYAAYAVPSLAAYEPALRRMLPAGPSCHVVFYNYVGGQDTPAEPPHPADDQGHPCR